MNDQEIKNLWILSNEKLELQFEENRRNMQEISNLKVHYFVSSIKPIKIFAALAGIIWVGFGVFILGNIYLYSFAQANKFFLFSATIQVGLTAIALWVYVYQLILIYQMDISRSIIETQADVARLQSSTIWVTRILFLQLPVWTTFWWSTEMFYQWQFFQLVLILTIAIFFTCLGIWFFVNIRYENKDKNWFRLLFSGNEWTPIVSAMELMDHVSEYKSPVKERSQHTQS
ncbi:hypothetical protein ACFP1I_32365 [Dyadobacter subterraneus]|uniref:Uncharacterized protein n=1 Tax=Dyadobacter subterraneus TaxID=2773304 RepID=A0ABR9WE04_9BACT|nr:hypothetical protein [Dyadobacter subterraneus]MBE9463715.1 hypothetical protein [Dyadobacter subterraneus]